MWAGWWSNCLPFCLPYPYSPCDSYNQSQFVALITFPPSLQKLLSTGRSWIFVNVQMSLLSHHNSAVKSALVLKRKSPRFSFTVLGARPSGITLLFCLTVPQQHVCFFAIAMYNLYPSSSVFLISSVNVTWVAVMCCAVHCLSFPKYIFTSYIYPVESQSLKFWCQNACISFVCTGWKSPFLWRKK